LARTTTAWATASIVVGSALATRADPWWRAFGQQHLGWGVVDLGVVGVARALQARRMRRVDNPYAPTALRRESGSLRKVLLINVGADAVYVVGGAVLWRARSGHPASAGAGAAIVIQGAFLLLSDASHARGGARV
jgi:hypothetical protein